MQETNKLTKDAIRDYTAYLEEQEKSISTIKKYTHELTLLHQWLAGRPLSKALLLEWKEALTHRYAANSVNVILAALNGFLTFSGWYGLKVKPLKIHRNLFSSEEKELTKAEYIRLVKAAESTRNQRMALVMQTICATGIRVSELRFITVESLKLGRAEISNKGKRRIVFLPEKLRATLRKYANTQKRTAGPVFVTKTGKPLDRSNIWRSMKFLCEGAKVNCQKVFPHNLRHLFARVYYTMEKDLSRLADILGHSNVNTTRIYTVESGSVHAKQVGRMGLVIT